MKKLLFLIGVAFMFTSMQAQRIYWSDFKSSNYQDSWQYYYGKYYAYYAGVSQLAFNANQNVPKNLKSKEKLIYHFKKGVKKEQPSSKSISTFTDGNITNYKFFKKGKLKNQFSFEYNEDGFYTKYYTGLVTYPKYEEQLVYNDSNRVVLYTTYNKKRRLKRKEVIEYDDKQHIIRKDIYDGKHLSPKYSWVYKYDENGKKVETEHYKKGKLQSKWVFTCDDEGKKVDKKDVKLTTTCSLVEHNNDGSYVKIYRNTDSKGRVRISRWSYSKDSLLIAYESRDHKDKVMMKYTNEYDNQRNRIVYTFYKKNGTKVNNKSTFKYDSEHRIVEITSYYSKDKMYKRTTYKYDNMGRKIETCIYKSKNKLYWKYVYTYNDNGEVISQITYKKDVPTYERNYIFQY